MIVSRWMRWAVRGCQAPTNRRSLPRRQRRANLLFEPCEDRLLLAVPTPTLTINDVHVLATNTGVVDAIFTVSLNPANIEQTVTVDFTTVAGTAKAGVDFQATTGTLSFTPDQVTKTVVVPVLADTITEPDETFETFSVALSNATNAVIGKAQGVGTIDDSAVPGAVQFSTTGTVVREDAGAATIAVVRTGGSAGTVSVHFATDGGTAIPGVDYVPVSGVLTFGPGQTVQTFQVPVINDLLLDGDKVVNVDLSQPSSNTFIGPRGTAPITILNVNSLVVTNTNDSGPGSLRHAIQTAEANPGPNRITFDTPGAGPFVIQPLSPLPAMNDTTFVDAATQPGYAGRPLVQLDGTHAGSQVSGLVFLASQNLVRGLAIGHFSGSGILVDGGHNSVIEDNDLGTDTAGTSALANALDGLSILNSAGNLVRDNVLSGNALVGLRISGAGSSGNMVQGNRVGSDVTGLTRLANGFDGVFLDGAPGNVVGGLLSGARNIISGNAEVGVQILGPTASGNRVLGNLIGTSATGAGRLANGFDGVFLNGAPGNTVGGANPAARNIISGNGFTGVRISGPGASGNEVLGNFIGTDASGTLPIGNDFDGIFIAGAGGNTVGGATPGAGNVVSGNGSVGVQLFGMGAAGNQVLGNLIGTDVSGTQPLGNGIDGLYLNNAPANTIGGAGTGDRNVISANRSAGIQLFGRSTAGNVVQGNLVGPDINGVPRLGNRFGLFLNSTGTNTIGGSGPGQANDITGNTSRNVFTGQGVGSASITTAGTLTSRSLVVRRGHAPAPGRIHAGWKRS